MPSRENGSSETKNDSRRSSLRRLSSLASLHALNPFVRRRSANNVNSTPSSTSNASFTSLAVDSPSEKHREISAFDVFCESSFVDHTVKPTPAATARSQSRQHMIPPCRSSYICLSDDPIGGMPRNRTFSNLPLPTRVKKSTNSLAASQSHTRLPSALLPSSGLLSPRMSSHKRTIKRLTAIDGNSIREKLGRCDTEPLFGISCDLASTAGCSSAFKENISLSPVMRLPSIDLMDNQAFYGSALPSRAYANRRRWADPSGMQQPQINPAHTYSSSTVLPSKYADKCGGAYGGVPQKYKNSSAFRSSRDRLAQRGQQGIPVQGCIPQPTPTDASTNKRSSCHGEIKQNKLMSAIQAPTPAPPRTPLGETHNQSKLRSPEEATVPCVICMHNPVRAIATPSATRPRAHSFRQEVGTASLSDCHLRLSRPTILPIQQAEPLSYWTGRFSSLSDRYRNEDLVASLNLSNSYSLHARNPNTWIPQTETDKIHTSEANHVRMRRAVEHLWYQCGTDEAKQSFIRWQKQLAAALNLPELGRSVGISASAKSCALEMSLKVEDQEGNRGPPSSEMRKMTFIDKLWGKKGKLLGSAA